MEKHLRNRLPFSFYIQVIICATLWGSAFPVLKNSFHFLNLETYGEQLVFAGTRFTLAGLLIVPFCRRKLVPNFLKAPKGPLIAIILCQTFFQYTLFYYGIRVSGGTLGALLVGTGSFWWIILAPILTKAPAPTLKHWILLSFCSLGIGIAVWSPGAGSGNVVLGSLSFLLSTLSGSIAAVYMKQVAPISGSRTTTAGVLFLGGVLLLMVSFGSFESYFSKFSFKALGVTIYLAFLSATAFTLWNRLIEKYSIHILSTYRFLIPLMGIVESALFIPGETIGIGTMTGGTIIIICIIIISQIPRDDSKPRSNTT